MRQRVGRDVDCGKGAETANIVERKRGRGGRTSNNSIDISETRNRMNHVVSYLHDLVVQITALQTKGDDQITGVVLEMQNWRHWFGTSRLLLHLGVDERKSLQLSAVIMKWVARVSLGELRGYSMGLVGLFGQQMNVKVARTSDGVEGGRYFLDVE
ncbi:hypothetical protein KCU88_g280, partial [Aureobasidium melanogenum]